MSGSKIILKWIRQAPVIFGAALFFVFISPASAQPANDNFADRIPFTGLPATIQGSNTLATLEPGEPAAGTHSVWWTWTAPVSSRVAMVRLAATFSSVVRVYAGDVLTNLTLVASSGTDSSLVLTFDAIAGTSYQIAVASLSSVRTGTIRLELRPPPANDNFSNRIVLSGNSITVSTTNYAATPEVDEPAHAGALPGASLWYTWTPEVSGSASVIFSQWGSGARAAVYTGDTLSNLTVIDSHKDKMGFPYDWLALRFVASAGTPYQIVVTGDEADNGAVAFDLNLTTLTISSPTNETVFETPSSIPVAITAADPLFDGTIASVRYSLNRLGYNFDLNLDIVFVDTLTVDGVAPAWEAVLTNMPPGKFVLQASATNLAGQVKEIAPVNFKILPSNDAFSNSVMMAGNSWSNNGTCVLATTEAGEPDHDGQAGGGASVWWNWTAPANGNVELNKSSFLFKSGGIYVYSGTSVSNLTLISAAPQSQSGGNNLANRFQAAAGVTYHIAVDSTNDPGPLGFGLGSLGEPSPGGFSLQLKLTTLNLLPTGSLWLGDGTFRTRVVGQVGEALILQASTDLMNWTNLTTNTLVSTNFDFIDTFASSFDRRFYRVVPLP